MSEGTIRRSRSRSVFSTVRVAVGVCFMVVGCRWDGRWVCGAKLQSLSSEQPEKTHWKISPSSLLSF